MNDNCWKWFALLCINLDIQVKKTPAVVCISRQALKGRKYLFRDIHNFSFSDKIQDDIFPLGTEYCCATLWVKNSLEIAMSVTISKIFSMFIFCWKSKIAAKSGENWIFSLLHSILMYYPAGQKITQNPSISYSFRDLKTFSFSAKIKVAIPQLAKDLQVSKFSITQYIKK